MIERDDKEFKDLQVIGIKRRDETIYIETMWGEVLVPQTPDEMLPRVGETIRIYGRGLGYPVRGVESDRHIFWYKTPEESDIDTKIWELEEDLKRLRRFRSSEMSKLDASYNLLPDDFKVRIDRFRANSKRFRWTREWYEVMCSEDAIEIAENIPDLGEVVDLRSSSWERVISAIPDLLYRHSPHSFAFTCYLAGLYVRDPILVRNTHGALCSIGGCSGTEFCYTWL